MTSNPNRYPRKRNNISLTGFATVYSSSDCGPLEDKQIHICDSAFLAERGIFTRMEPGKFPSHSTYGRTSEAA